ncbi:MAG: hypothetical protein K5905_27850 [Roseibium sp.]|uniref:hypothetical protein n=1 Tax=Roseibium sp. TaxID=1936156 RepID=UPI002615C274|nr:hypothetical protein [Roseibium sp.]MCV0429281.1 hypothetical protein [Roseibium sp.]
MSNYTYRLPIDEIDAGYGDAFAQGLFSLWRRTEGNLTDEYENYYSKIVLFDGNPVVGDSPELLDCGFEALPLKLLGSTWSEDTEHLRSFLPADYRAMVGRSYFEASVYSSPTFDIVRADLKNDEGAPVAKPYKRLILPVREGGFRCLLSYSFGIETLLPVKDRSKDSENLAVYTQRKPGGGSLYQAVVGSSERHSFRVG